ncbi:MAG: tetratricopeptide repeat protein [Proteobacteria bacterium]|nr:tetratricopeptide repeat protein [Pseudomonadota bacterium]MCP4920076.1 tetratricopeptide repeat protein [Pseudomonadota bacterium]
MCERAHELGAATVLRATHNDIPAPMDGIGGLLARMFRCQGLARPSILDRARTGLKSLGLRDAEDWEAVADLVAAASGDGERRSTGSPAQSYQLVQRVLRARSQVRPLILWIDDVQWGADTLGCIETLLRSDQGASVLVLLTERGEARDAHPLALEALERLGQNSRSGKLPLGPLTQEEQVDLARRVLGLEPKLAARVLDRAGGTPLFAVQLVGDWLARGQLVRTRGGLVLAEGAEDALPDGLHDLFLDRLDRVLGDDGGAWRALELAAVLGRQAEETEWRTACWQVGHLVRPETLSRLVDAGLLSHDAQGEGSAWRFEHSLLHESLVRRAREGGRLADYHLACAAALEELYPDARPAQERIGQYYLAAGAWHDAIDPLLEAARACRANSEFLKALELLRLLEETLDHANAPPEHPARGHAGFLRAMVCRYVGRYEESLRLATELEVRAERYAWPVIHARAIELLGNIARIQRDLPRALVRIEDALARFRTLGFDRGIGTCLLGVGAVLWQMGDLDGARASFDESLEHHRRIDNIGWMADSLNGLAELARTLGELDLAEPLYAKALELHTQARSGIAIVVRLNTCLVRIARGRFVEAEDDLQKCLASFERQGRSTYQGAVHLLLLPGAAERQDWAAWDQHIRRGLELVTASGMIEKDVAWPAFMAGEIAAAKGQERRAWEALVIARSQWKALGDDANAELASIAMKKLAR